VGSNKAVWWKCKKGHSWKATVNSRSRKGKGRKQGGGCPYCAGKKVLAGFNDLETLNPVVAGEWDNGKNMLTTSQVTVASGKSVWWKCRKEGHSWRATIASRTINGNNCPYCAGQRVLKGFNDLETLNPELADEWDCEKNLLAPSQVTVGSGKYVWWKCHKEGHSWRTTVADRHSNGSRCPYCLGAFPYTPRCVK
jgi:DNA-directed RNA polymerase subunit RPC12/RpoP